VNAALPRLLLAGLAALVAWSAWNSWALRSYPQADGVLVAAEPLQTALDPAPEPLARGDYRIQPLARYDITARLLHRESYHFGRETELSPLDFALGWGPMSDNRVLDRLKISQGNRFYYLHWQDPPRPPAELMQASANTHLIPADRGVARALDRMRPGEVVHLRGFLVSVTAPDGWYWNSSLSRTDTGAGACELMWVEQAFTEKPG
jgi:hypothetical protein